MFNLFFLIVIILFIRLFQLKVMRKPFGEESGVGTCNLTPFSKPTCSKKNNSLRRTWIEPMLSLGNLATLLGGKFPNHCAIWPHFLGQVAKKKKKKGLRQIFQGEGELELDGYLWELANELEIPWGTRFYFKQWRNMGKPCLLMTTRVHLSRETMFAQGIWASLPWATMFS